MEPIISLSHVRKVFRDSTAPPLTALEDITLDIHAGEIFVFLGPSGSGKSTLLRIMSGLEHEFGGTVRLGSGIGRGDMNFVFQQFALLPWLSVADNVGLGLHARHLAPHEQKARVARELARLGLEKFGRSYPRELSGGMRQRVGIARALATDPKIIFMDEPFSELDSFTADELRREVLQIWADTRPTIIMVTHLIGEAIELADRIAVLSSRPGSIKEIVPNHLVRPRARRSPEFWKMEDKLDSLIRL
ncbi:MAG: ABC transporter ATP-binding protein [Candidatus Sungbacteria bacterium]|uniref:ABC transporter ATP-binding protein n=1 Tax=Candidatus Sungiibacteriota bacterium TaxID=2750080 RepID=A0A932R0W6_9BACT|nr:ABC transporter ATP-binding protein [Candidatus Sungbacteria bacterium]